MSKPRVDCKRCVVVPITNGTNVDLIYICGKNCKPCQDQCENFETIVEYLEHSKTEDKV